MKFYTACCVDDLKSWANIEITDVEKFEKWLFSNENMNEDVRPIYSDTKEVNTAADSYGLDTQDRDLLMDEVAFHLVGSRWPLNLDGPEYMRDFVRNLKTALENCEWAKFIG